MDSHALQRNPPSFYCSNKTIQVDYDVILLRDWRPLLVNVGYQFAMRYDPQPWPLALHLQQQHSLLQGAILSQIYQITVTVIHREAVGKGLNQT